MTIGHEQPASPQEMILEYLQNHDEIGNRTVRQLTDIGSENRVTRILQKMVKAGEIEKIPGRRKSDSGYRLPSGIG